MCVCGSCVCVAFSKKIYFLYMHEHNFIWWRRLSEGIGVEMWLLKWFRWTLRGKLKWRWRLVWVGIWIVFERYLKKQESSYYFPS